MQVAAYSLVPKPGIECIPAMLAQCLRVISMLLYMPIRALAEEVESFGVRAHAAVNGGFTVSEISFSILEHLVKTAGGLRAL